MNAQQTSAAPSAQYRKRNNGTFAGKLMAVIFAIIMIAVGVYMVQMFRQVSAVDVEAVETGGTVISDNELQATVDITRDDTSKPAYCIIYALDYNKAEVGRRELVIPAGGERVQRVEFTMPTFARAHAAQVYGCSTVVPPHLSM